VSGDDTGDDYDLSAVMDGEAAAESGVAEGDLMNAFAEGVCHRDPDQTAAARAGIVAALGDKAMSDAAAVIAAFNAYPRAADATGLPLEDAKAEGTVEMRAEFGFDSLDTRDAF
jgi:hypothetical protein